MFCYVFYIGFLIVNCCMLFVVEKDVACKLKGLVVICHAVAECLIVNIITMLMV